jgi:hypothetical protein
MPRVTPIQNSFNAGELSPLLMGRQDQSVYAIGLERCENFVPLIQGPALKRSGTRFVAAAKGAFRPLPFEFNTTQTYVIEAGEEYFRFFTNNAQIMAGGLPYELETPYSYEQVLELDHVQSGDVLYLLHGEHAPRTLTRTGAEAFALAEWALANGPFDDDNADESVTVSASASTGTVTLWASEEIFEAGHVGGLFRMEARDFAEIPSWEPSTSVAVGQLRQWSGKVYQKVGGATHTGTVPPIHAEGVEWDGMGSGTKAGGTTASGGVQWRYLHDRFGILRITAFTSAKKVTAEVLRRLPWSAAAANSYDSGAGLTYSLPYTEGSEPGYYPRYQVDESSGDPVFEPPVTGDDYEPEAGGEDIAAYGLPGTWRWAFGAFSAARGWPEAGFIWNERMVLAKGATLYGSAVGSYADFRERNDSGEIAPDMAFRFTLNSPNAIQWIMGDVQLLVGTSAREHVAQAAGEGVPGPTNFAAPSHTSYGSAKIKPLFVGGRVLFVQKDRRKLREFDFELARERFNAPDLTLLASHLTKAKIKWLAFQAAPHSLVYAGLDDGAIRVLAYSPEQEVKGWSRLTLPSGSAAGWGACILDPAGELDQLWLHVERGGAHWVERLETWRDAGDARGDAFHVDHGLSYEGAAASVISGLDHLAGEPVRGLADGKPIGPLTVSEAGAVTLPEAASKVHLGLFFSASCKSLRPNTGAEDGTAQGRLKRVAQLAPRLLETGGVRVRAQDCEWEELEFHRGGEAMDEAPDLFTGDMLLDVIGDYERGGQWELESTAPLPCCLVAMCATIKVGAAS